VSSWYFQPFLAAGLVGVFRPTLFDLRGVDFAAWTLAAFAIAALAGLVIRRSVAALTAAAGAWAGLFTLATLYLRAHYQAPLIGKPSADLGGSGIPWTLNFWWTGPNGHVLGRSAFTSVMRRMLSELGAGPATPAGQRWLAQHGYVNWVRYQPASRFWPFQLIEGGWLLALALLLGAATIWLVRRRPG
jgi:hypothetical protein